MRSDGVPSTRSKQATWAPSPANRSATARPMPDAPPVTTATSPSNEPDTTPPLSLVKRMDGRQPGEGEGAADAFGSFGGGHHPAQTGPSGKRYEASASGVIGAYPGRRG